MEEDIQTIQQLSCFLGHPVFKLRIKKYEVKICGPFYCSFGTIITNLKMLLIISSLLVMRFMSIKSFKLIIYFLNIFLNNQWILSFVLKLWNRKTTVGLKL